MRIGMVRALSATPTMIAIEKGYFKEYGIKVEVSDIDTTALIPLAQNRRAGHGSGGDGRLFQRAREEFSDHHRHRPRRHADRPQAADPAGPEGQDQDHRRPQGQGSSPPTRTASVSTYEIGKMLASAGLTLKDIELKMLPFPQMGVGLANKAVDARHRHSALGAPS